MTSRGYVATRVAELCRKALANIDAEIIKVQEKEIQSVLETLRAERLAKSKRKWYRWFPQPFVEPTRDDAIEYSAKCEYWFEDSIRMIPNRYSKLQENIQRVLSQAAVTFQATGNDSITVSSDDWRLIRNWVKQE